MTMRLANELVAAEETWAGVMPARQAVRTPRWLQWLGRLAGVLPKPAAPAAWPPAQSLAAEVKVEARSAYDGVWPRLSQQETIAVRKCGKVLGDDGGCQTWLAIYHKMLSAETVHERRAESNPPAMRLVKPIDANSTPEEVDRFIAVAHHDLGMHRASMSVADLDAPDPYDMAG